MYQPVTYQTAQALAAGISPGLIAKLDGVKPNTIHKRRLRFDAYVGNGKTPRLGKPGRRRKGQSIDEQISRLDAERAAKPQRTRKRVDEDGE